MLPRSGLARERVRVAKVRAMDSADIVVGEKTGNEIAVMSRENIKNGDFITVIWRHRRRGGSG